MNGFNGPKAQGISRGEGPGDMGGLPILNLDVFHLAVRSNQTKIKVTDPTPV